MSNIYDSANQIEREIRELQEFKALEEAYAKVKANEEAHRLFKDFQAAYKSAVLASFCCCICFTPPCFFSHWKTSPAA